MRELQREGRLVRYFRRSSPGVDARGIDIFVSIRLPGKDGVASRTMTVPIEIKSSPRGVEKWKVVHSDLHRAGVLIFFLPTDASPRKIRRLFHRALTRVGQNSRDGTLYRSLFQRLFTGRGSKNLRRNTELIRRARKRR